MLSVVVTVLPSGCWYTSPVSKSSKYRPCQPCFVVMRSFLFLAYVISHARLAARRSARPGSQASAESAPSAPPEPGWGPSAALRYASLREVAMPEAALQESQPHATARAPAVVGVPKTPASSSYERWRSAPGQAAR